MTFVEHLTGWVEANAETLSGLGRCSVQASDHERSKPSAHVAVEGSNGFVEIVVWDSGEAEFAYGVGADAGDEHHEVETTEELDELLSAMMRWARRLKGRAG